VAATVSSSPTAAGISRQGFQDVGVAAGQLAGVEVGQVSQFSGDPMMEVHEWVIEIKLLERRLTLYEENHGILSEDFHAALVAGKHGGAKN
jgi:hypothetical protein